jgi:hypothetical protein
MEFRIDYTTVLRAFVEKDIDFAVAGGFAVVAHGAVRVTMDLDLALALTTQDLQKSWNTLKELGFRCKLPITAAQFSDPKKLTALAVEKNMKAVSFFHEKQPFLVVDLLFTEEFRFTESDIERMPLFGVDCPVLNKKTLIKLKTAAGRDKDLDDIRALKALTKKI